MNKFLLNAIEIESKKAAEKAIEAAKIAEKRLQGYKAAAKRIVDMIESEIEKYSKDEDTLISEFHSSPTSVYFKIDFGSHSNDFGIALNSIYSTCAGEGKYEYLIKEELKARGFKNPEIVFNYTYCSYSIDVDHD